MQSFTLLLVICSRVGSVTSTASLEYTVCQSLSRKTNLVFAAAGDVLYDSAEQTSSSFLNRSTLDLIFCNLFIEEKHV